MPASRLGSVLSLRSATLAKSALGAAARTRHCSRAAAYLSPANAELIDARIICG